MKSMILVVMVALTGCSGIALPRSGQGPSLGAVPRPNEVFTVRFRADCEVCSIRFSGPNGQTVTVEKNWGSWSQRLSFPGGSIVHLNIYPVDGKQLYSASIELGGTRVAEVDYVVGSTEPIDLRAILPGPPPRE